MAIACISTPKGAQSLTGGLYDRQSGMELLRAQGHAAGTPDRDGWVRVWIHGSNDAIDVKAGRELHELAEGKLSFEELRERREDEAVIER